MKIVFGLVSAVGSGWAFYLLAPPQPNFGYVFLAALTCVTIATLGFIVEVFSLRIPD